ncbi:DUF302 domain-containing protein [uncultured Tateyamaria sp.]|uniref:DUF302 domain-containing protein n=1 Tax=uncultured Tateyamaria sp. TaxID=455651 RepID=UPI002617442D|nr:DUF302 domain-containing protein [uncultured Tateyamaria sp.]
MRLFATIGFILAMTGAAMAGDNGIERKKAAAGVAETVDQLVAAMEGAGLKIFARVDHGAGAQSIGEDIGASQLLIFGNPKVGTPAIKDDPVSGLFLPLKVLVYEDGGQTWIAYQKPADMLGPLGGVAEDAPYINVMTGALGKFTDAVAE